LLDITIRGEPHMSSLRRLYYDLFSKIYDMEHAKPRKRIPRLLFYVRLYFLGSKDAKKFLGEEESILGKRFINIAGQMSPTGQSKLIYAEKVLR